MSLFSRFRIGGGKRPYPPLSPAAPAVDAMQKIEAGNASEDAGELREALECYDQAIILQPGLARAHLNRGNALLALDRAEEAKRAYETALDLEPGYAAAHYNLANALLRLGRRADALAAYRRAIELKPDFTDAEVAIGTLHADLGGFEDAAASYRRALAIDPDYAAVHANLANVLQHLDRPDDAIGHYQRAIELDPRLPGAYHELGSVLQRVDRHEEAVASFSRAVQLDPGFALAHAGLGASQQALGRNEDAAASYRRAVQAAPGEAAFQVGLGVAVRATGNNVDALAALRRAVDLAPGLAGAHYHLGEAQLDLGLSDAAAASFRTAVKLDPRNANAHCMLGNIAAENGRMNEAIAAFEQLLAIEPKSVIAHNNLGNALRRLNRIEDSASSYRRALEIDPDLAAALSNLLFLENSLTTNSTDELPNLARRFGEVAARNVRPFTSWPGIRIPDRTLRVGFVSGDLRSHPVGYFLDGVLARLASTPGFGLELYAYSSHDAIDAVSDRIRASCRSWRPVARLTDDALANQIHADQIDILIDLSGHTAHNRLRAFAWKPAPVQVTWLGYLGTTGVREIDYLIADEWTLPNTEERFFTEEIWRVKDCYLCFTPPADSIDAGPLPASGSDGVTFGSFNNLAKVNDVVIEIWARVLGAVPQGRLFLKSEQFQDPAIRYATERRFARFGVDAARLLLEPLVARADYLKPFLRVDIALDPFPYPGITTTVENLWMGVPVLTMGGTTFQSRQGVGILMNAGLPEWISSDADDYVRRAEAHVKDLRALAALRASLRERVASSPIFDESRFAGNFSSALREMWSRWCEGGNSSRESRASAEVR